MSITSTVLVGQVPYPSHAVPLEQDCVQSEGKLYLIFEFVDRDLKKYMEAAQGMLDPMLVKARCRNLNALPRQR